MTRTGVVVVLLAVITGAKYQITVLVLAEGASPWESDLGKLGHMYTARGR